VKWPVLIRPRAEADLRDARDWYEQQRVGLGDAFLIEVRHAIELLAEQPERRPIYYRGFRRLLTRRFHYKLFYLREDTRVVVFRLLHAKRDHPRHLH
jgi:toxin ParE1/3/4